MKALTKLSRATKLSIRVFGQCMGRFRRVIRVAIQRSVLMKRVDLAVDSNFSNQVHRVRTKYDRMFERKNQDILSKHYNKLVDHSQDSVARDDLDEDDFITLKRIDHDLPQDGELPADHISKRKLKMGQSKRAMLKDKGQPTHLTFDDDGNPHEVHELKDMEDVFGEGGDAEIFEAGRRFLESERGKLKEADVWDKE